MLWVQKKDERRATHPHACCDVCGVGRPGQDMSGANEAFVAQNSCNGSTFAMYKSDNDELNRMPEEG